MPKALHYLCLLIIIVLIGCQNDQEKAFEPWQLFNAQTTHVLAFNNTSIGLQNLKQHSTVRGLFSLPKMSASLDSLSARLSRESSSYLFVQYDETLGQKKYEITEFSWVFPINDSIPVEAANELIFGQDTVFIYSENQYRIYSNKNSLGVKANLSQNKTLNGLKTMIQLKKDKPLVIGQKLSALVGKVSFNSRRWAVYDPQASSVGASAHGVLLVNDSDSLLSKNQSLVLDLGQKPSILSSPTVIPLTAKSSSSLVLNNPQSLTQKMKAVDSLFVVSPLLETLEEASLIEFNSGMALVLKSMDINMSLGTMNQSWASEDNFRGVALRGVEPEDLKIRPLDQIFTDIPELTHAFIWEEYIILCANSELAKEYITQLQNKNTLAQSSAWVAAQEDIARESSILVARVDAPNKSFETLQLIEDNGFAHINYSLQSGSQKITQETKGPLLRSIQVNAPISSQPQFFSNHKSGGKNIVVQDENHRLYFIAPNGKTLWYRDLMEPILGPIQEVDLLRNGKKQLAFVTESKWYIIDRNGRDVAPFPKRFRDPITQPLAIFDYDNNRKYRFVVIQDRSVLMYDAQGKRVKGFTYEKAPAIVSHPPTHLRINGKDYLLFLLKNGQLQILSRTGKVRIPVAEQFNFSTEVPVKHEGKIVFWTEDGSQILISETGAIVKLTAKSPAQYRVVYHGAHTIEFDDPLLRIDQQLIELPLGNYLGPQVFKFGNKLRSVMVDKDSQNVYVYNSEGRILKDLPFFGNSAVDMADINSNGQLELIVQGQSNEILIYSVN
jgi:hypothetical protein